jgi:adenylate kinase
LADKLGLAIVATGDLLKKAIAEENQWGLEAKALQDEGRVVTEDIILGLLREQLLRPEMTNGFILDGFPRNLLQALTLDELLLEIGKPLDRVLLIDIDNDNLMERLVGRRTCRSCGQLYNAYRNPPTVEGVCDVCGGRLHQRSDDNEETVSSRIHVFDHLIAPLITHYTKSDQLIRVDGNGSLEQVFENLIRAIEAARASTNQAVATLPSVENRARLEKKPNSESEEQPKTALEQEVEKQAQPVAKKSPPKKRAGKSSNPAKKGLTKKSKTIADKKVAVSESDKQTKESRGGKKTSSKKTVSKLAPAKKRTQVEKKKKVRKKTVVKKKKSLTNGKSGTLGKTTKKAPAKKGKVSVTPKKSVPSKKKVAKKRPQASKTKLNKKVTKKKLLLKKARKTTAKKRPATKKKVTSKQVSASKAKKVTGKLAKKRVVKQNKSARKKALKKKSKK